MKVLGVYDVKDRERCCGIFESRKEIKEFLKIEYNTISNAIKRKGRIGRRFEIYEIEITDREE